METDRLLGTSAASADRWPVTKGLSLERVGVPIETSSAASGGTMRPRSASGRVIRMDPVTARRGWPVARDRNRLATRRESRGGGNGVARTSACSIAPTRAPDGSRSPHDAMLHDSPHSPRGAARSAAAPTPRLACPLRTRRTPRRARRRSKPRQHALLASVYWSHPASYASENGSRRALVVRLHDQIEIARFARPHQHGRAPGFQGRPRGPAASAPPRTRAARSRRGNLRETHRHRGALRACRFHDVADQSGGMAATAMFRRREDGADADCGDRAPVDNAWSRDSVLR